MQGGAGGCSRVLGTGREQRADKDERRAVELPRSRFSIATLSPQPVHTPSPLPPHHTQAVSVEDEEFCAIPMGGCLPVHPQRVVGVGGTAGMVHPSTGYMVSRVLGAAPLVADAIIDQLSSGGWVGGG